MGYPQNGWFIMENPIKMDDLKVLPFQETFRTYPSHQVWSSLIMLFFHTVHPVRKRVQRPSASAPHLRRRTCEGWTGRKSTETSGVQLPRCCTRFFVHVGFQLTNWLLWKSTCSNQFGPLYQGLEGKHLNSSILPWKHPICLTGLLSTAMRSSFWILENSRKKKYVEATKRVLILITIDWLPMMTSPS